MSNSDLLQPLLGAFLASGVLLAAAIAAGLWKTEPARRIALWLAPGAGYLVGAWLVRGIPSLPPREAAGWIFWAVALAAAIGLALPRNPRFWLVWPGRIVGAAILVYLIVRPLIGRTWEGNEAIIWPVTMGIAVLASWTLIARGRETQPAWTFLPAVLLATAGLSILLMVGGVASYSLYALGLAGAVAGTGIGALPIIRRRTPESRPAASLVCLPWAGLLVAGHVYADVPLASAIAALASLAAFLIPSVPKVNRLPRWGLAAIQLGWIAVTFGAAIAWTYHNAPRFDF